MRQPIHLTLVASLSLVACETAEIPPAPEPVPKPRLRMTSEENLGERAKSIELLLFDDGSAELLSRERVPGPHQPEPILLMQIPSFDEEAQLELEAVRDAVLLWQRQYRPTMIEPWPRRDVYIEHIEPQESWTTVIEGVDRADSHPDTTPLALVYRILMRLDRMLGVEIEDGWNSDIVLQNAAVSGGEDVVALLRMRNHSDEIRELWYPTGCNFDWRVEDAGGNSFHADRLCTQDTSVLRFLPGQGQVFIVRLSTHDPPGSGMEKWIPSLAPGRYTLYGGCLAEQIAQADFVVESRH